MFCHSCGSQVENGLQFCPACGQAMQVGVAPALPAAFIVPAGVQAQTGRWISEGWQIVKQDMGTFALVGLVFVVLNGAVPLILQGSMMIGLHMFIMKRMMNRRAELADLFNGFSFFLPGLVATLLIGLFTGAASLLCLIPGLVVAAMYKFTYLFIFDKRMDFWPAMQASHAVVKNDYFGFTMFLLALALVNLVGALCCIVGIFISIPVTVAAITVAYRDIVGFDPQTAERL